MSWFKNFYQCSECGNSWHDDWSATCDDDCPHCGSRHMSLYDSDDLSVIVEGPDDKGVYTVMRSADDAEDSPDYQCVFRTNTKERAQQWIDEQ
jgi:DNA-directed RNA polymerase subunit RPC12/RpoP